MKNILKISFFVAAITVFLFGVVCINAQNPGYYYSYDASGNRETRTYTTVFLKEGDTTMFQNAVDNYVVKIFPNPVKDYLQVEITGLTKDNFIKIQLLDIKGLVLFQWENIKGTFQIETKDLAQGSYFLNIFIDDKRSFWKIIKEY